jgi:hypothetical protein
LRTFITLPTACSFLSPFGRWSDGPFVPFKNSKEKCVRCRSPESTCRRIQKLWLAE